MIEVELGKLVNKEVLYSVLTQRGGGAYSMFTRVGQKAIHSLTREIIILWFDNN